MNHPNIAAIYGLEEDRALVLVQRDNPGRPISVETVLALARQLAEALGYAQERGMVHRDWKPANLKVTPEGRITTLDFGLVKAMIAVEAPSDSTETIDQTQQGTNLGTAGYMRNRPAGKATDKRADIWAFGVVLYELPTGQRASGGQTRSGCIAAALTTEPDWSAAW